MAIIFMKIRICTPFMGEIHRVQQEADKLCFKEVKGAPAIAKEIAKGWLSQGDYNKLIHMFKACTQSNAAGVK